MPGRKTVGKDRRSQNDEIENSEETYSSECSGKGDIGGITEGAGLEENGTDDSPSKWEWAGFHSFEVAMGDLKERCKSWVTEVE